MTKRWLSVVGVLCGAWAWGGCAGRSDGGQSVAGGHGGGVGGALTSGSGGGAGNGSRGSGGAADGTGGSSGTAAPSPAQVSSLSAPEWELTIREDGLYRSAGGGAPVKVYPPK